MDRWERFDKTLLPDRETFYSSLNKEDITDVDYRNAKIVLKYLYANNKNLVVYCDLYVQSDTCCLLTYLRISETNVLKYVNLPC